MGRIFRQLPQRLRTLLPEMKAKWNHEMEEEVRFHLEMETEENTTCGMSLEEGL
ncbi:MAG: hypothetical protein M2R45_00764 [Verrucomicrobia subdivision 3 bacterium]|nr:hypothetical protein [Limisphaerales bacterium]MCS1413130.1 hypothetical protein [Limisphaerales bacterium]